MNVENRFGLSKGKGEDKLNSRARAKDPNQWFRVPEVWLVLFLIGSAVVGSLALVATALEHRDELVASHRPIASPLPPSHAQRPADEATP
jgi:hypothetical protein